MPFIACLTNTQQKQQQPTIPTPSPHKQEASRHSGQSSTTKTNPEHTNTPHNQSRSPSNSPRVSHVCIWVDNRDNPMVSGSSRRCSRPLSSSQSASPPTRTRPHHTNKLPKGAQRTSPATTHPEGIVPEGNVVGLISQSSTVCQDPPRALLPQVPHPLPEGSR